MSEEFKWDVFVSYSRKDEKVVHPLAERLRSDGLRVWLDVWEVKPGDHLQVKVEEGLQDSRVLLLCMSAHTLGSDWVRFEEASLRFRDPLNVSRRFIPLKLDKTEPREALRAYEYVSWMSKDRKSSYSRLLEACQLVKKITLTANLSGLNQKTGQLNTLKSAQISQNNHPARAPFGTDIGKHDYCTRILEGHIGRVYAVSITRNGRWALSGGADKNIKLWDLKQGSCVTTFDGHHAAVMSVAISNDGRLAISGSLDQTLKIWDLDRGYCLRTLKGHLGPVMSVAITPDAQRAVSGSQDNTLRVWNPRELRNVNTLNLNCGWVHGVAITENGQRAVSANEDNTVIVHDLEDRVHTKLLRGHTGRVFAVAITGDGRRVASGNEDTTVSVWDFNQTFQSMTLEGHIGPVYTVALTSDGRFVVSGSEDMTIRIWDVDHKKCLIVLEGHQAGVITLSIAEGGRYLISGSKDQTLRVWDLEKILATYYLHNAQNIQPITCSDQVLYACAKALVVGESGVGKTGIFMRLVKDKWEPTDSTVGAWATQWRLPMCPGNGSEREIWLWDFGGQADQRLIHQLYMDDTALALLVFDGQKEDLFETLGIWDRDLHRASRRPFTKLLAVGRIDAGGLRPASRGQLQAFATERGYARFLETSAKEDTGCEELKQAIIEGIPWGELTKRSSPTLFKRLKDEIVRLKDEGRVLMRFNELREALQLRLLDEKLRFDDAELKTVIVLLAGPGVVWELGFGSWVLLQPEVISSYAQAVIRTIAQDEHARGCIPEDRVRQGDLDYHSSMQRLPGEDERTVLLAMHKTLGERGLCLREHTGQGTMLVFPSYYRRERPELKDHPAVLVSYRFSGFMDEIYATLVVRMHYAGPFVQDQLWRYAADFKTLTGLTMGVMLTRKSEGSGELEVYFDPAIPVGEKMIFSKYVHEHLLRYAKDVERLRHYVCPYCGTPTGNREVAMRRLADGKKNMLCVYCEKRLNLWDEMEQLFASDKTRQEVLDLEKASQAALDRESKERVLVGEVISTVALAGQICRELSVSDHGIDMEIEFKDDAGEARGCRVYLQLKSGDSYVRGRKKDSSEIFDIKEERHARYWMEQPFPVILVIRDSEGKIRWMEVREWLKAASDNGKKQVRQIVFEGQRFDVMAVRRWRDEALRLAGA